MPPQSSRQSGFTLLEISMIIILIALIIGAILVGQSLIRNAELRSVITEVSRYTQAIHDFRDKFRALPGDYSSATSLWGAANGNIVVCPTTEGIGTQTCNGNGDGRITSQTVISTATQYEQFRAWQHLANASTIEGSYNGIAGENDPQDAILGRNVPRSKLNGAGYSLISMYASEAAVTEHYFPLDYMHILQFGADQIAISPSTTLGPILTVQEAFALDSKQDDGLPGSGRIIAARQTSPFTPNCTNSDVATTARYNVLEEGYRCSLLFLLGF